MENFILHLSLTLLKIVLLYLSWIRDKTNLTRFSILRYYSLEKLTPTLLSTRSLMELPITFNPLICILLFLMDNTSPTMYPCSKETSSNLTKMLSEIHLSKMLNSTIWSRDMMALNLSTIRAYLLPQLMQDVKFNSIFQKFTINKIKKSFQLNRFQESRMR